MKLLKFLKQYLKGTAFIFLIAILNIVFFGVAFIGWTLLNNTNIVMSIVGAIIFLIASGYSIVMLLALILTIFTIIFDK